MSRFPACIRGLVLAGAVALVSLPAAAQAGGGHKAFCGTYGGYYGGGCYKPGFCYQPSYVYRPPVYCQPVYQPWIFNCHQPHYGGSGPVVILRR
jgi:hypothetical protein